MHRILFINCISYYVYTGLKGSAACWRHSQQRPATLRSSNFKLESTMNWQHSPTWTYETGLDLVLLCFTVEAQRPSVYCCVQLSRFCVSGEITTRKSCRGRGLVTARLTLISPDPDPSLGQRTSAAEQEDTNNNQTWLVWPCLYYKILCFTKGENTVFNVTTPHDHVQRSGLTRLWG